MTAIPEWVWIPGVLFGLMAFAIFALRVWDWAKKAQILKEKEREKSKTQKKKSRQNKRKKKIACKSRKKQRC